MVALMEQPISTTPEQPVDDPIPTVVENVPSPETAAKRSTDASFGMAGTLGMSEQDYHDAFMSGQESSVRRYAASTIDQKFNEANQKAIVNKIRQKPISELNPEDMEALTTPISRTDPSSVFEAEWAKKYMDHLNWPLNKEDFNWMKTVAIKHPELYQQGINIGTEATAKIKWVDGLHDDNVDNLSKQGWAGYLWDKAKDFTAIHPLLKRFYRLPSPDILNLPFDEMKKKVLEANESFNPSDRVAFTEYLKGESTSDRFINTILPIAQPGLEVSAIAGLTGAFRIGPRVGTVTTPRVMSGAEMSGVKEGFKDVTRGTVGTVETPRMMTPDEIVRAGGSRMLSKEEIDSMGKGLATANAPRSLTPEELAGYKSNLEASLNRSMTQEELYRARLASQQIASAETPGRSITSQELTLFQTAIRNMVRDVASKEAPEIAAPLAAGNLGEAVSRSAQARVVKKLMRRGDPTRDALDFLQNIFKTRVEGLRENPGNNGAAGITHLEEAYDTKARSFPEMILRIARAEKAPVLQEAMPEAIKAVQQEIKDQNKNIGNNLLDVGIPYREPVSNTWFADLRVGETSSEYFGKEGTAHAAAKRMNLDGYEVKPEGAGFFIAKPIPVDINTSGMKKYFADLPGNQSPFSVTNAFIGRLRTPNETLSSWQIRNRAVTDHAPSVILNYMAKELEDVRKLASWTFKGTNRKEMWDDFERVLDNARSLRDPETNIPGYTFRNPGELQYHYMKWIGRLPTDGEERAYFAWSRVNDLDHALRVISIVNHKQTNGVMAHRFAWIVDGEKVYSPEFEATPVTRFPGGSSHTVIVLGDKPGEERITQVSRLGSDLKKLEEAVNTGKAQMAQIWAPEYSPLAGYGSIKQSHHAVWVISHTGFETKPIDWTTQLPKQGGGHFAYSATHWVSQPNLRVEISKGDRMRIIYLGDNKYMPFEIQKLGSDVLGHINNAVEHIKGKRFDEAQKIVEDTLHMDWKDFSENFTKTATRDANTGRFTRGNEPRFNMMEPFQLIENNKKSNVNELERRIKDKYPNAEFVDGTRSGSRNKQFQVEFSQERDASDMFTINDVGSAGNPVFKPEKAKLLDAIPTMNRAMTKVSNSFLMDDYKNYSFNHWLAENKQHLNVSESEINSSPLYWFHHAEFHPETDKTIAYQAETQRMQIKQFLGQVSDTDNLLHGMTQKLVNSIYERMGKNVADKLDPPWLLATLKDPTRFIRSMTFHLKMGFSIPQIFVQSNIYVNIAGIAGPVRASQGTFAAMMHVWTKVNADPAIIAALDNKATYFGWKPGEFTEARQALLGSGFGNTGREQAFMDDIMSNRVISRGGQKFLDWGTFPFKAGDSMGRYGAFYTAFREFRDLHPTGQLTNGDILQITERASLLNANMSRSSNALYQKGWASLPTQFLSYTLRQAELMWGHRLTSLEKARLLGTNMLVYGVPIGLGVTGLPSEYWIRQNAIENGYVPNSSNYVSSLITEGIPSTVLALVNGGTFYNIPEKFGGSGLTNLSEAFRSDKTMWDILGGAAFGTAKGLFDTADSLTRAMVSGMNGDGKFFNTLPEHVLAVAREAVAVNNAWKVAVAIKTGEWMTKNEKVLDRDINPLQAVLMGMTGTQTQSASDLNVMYTAMEEEKALSKWAETRFVQEFHRGIRAYDNGDKDNGEAFMTLAFTYMNTYIPVDQRTQILTDASKGWETVMERVHDQFYLRHVTPSLEEVRQQSYGKLQQQLQQGPK